MSVASVTTLTPKPLPSKVALMGDRAVEAVDEFKSDLTEWFETDFNALLLAWARVSERPEDQIAINELLRTSHNLAGAETLYDQPDISRLCRSLVKLMKRGKIRTDISLIGLHIDACRAISANKHAISNGEDVCEALETEVGKLIAA